MAKSFTLTQVPRADLWAAALGLVLALVAQLVGLPGDTFDGVDTESAVREIVTAFGALIGLAATIRAAYYKGKIEDPTAIGDRSLTKTLRETLAEARERKPFERVNLPTVPTPPRYQPPPREDDK